MAGEVLPTAPGDPSPLSERRIVLLGKAEAKKHGVVRVLLGDTKLNEECIECSVYKGEQAGRKICIVDTPGWDRISIECTSPKIREEITRSVTLCAPGPHALILVLPINTGDLPSVNELKSACQHMELLSERVWNYTMVLFLCDGDVEESRVKDHIQNAEKLLQKCRGRHYVVRRRSFETELEFLKEIDSMVDENIRDSKVKESGDFFLPQVHYDTMQSKMPHKQKGEDKSEGKYGLRQRRESYQLINPSMTKQTEESEIHKDGTEALKSKNLDQLHYIKPAVGIVMAFICALIGSHTP